MIRQREQELVDQLSAQAEARELAAKVEWETEFQTKTRVAIEPLKIQLARIEKERDEANQIATEHARHVQNLEKKLTEASSFLNGWRNGKPLVGA
jgi:chromosome segregation ATPase